MEDSEAGLQKKTNKKKLADGSERRPLRPPPFHPIDFRFNARGYVVGVVQRRAASQSSHLLHRGVIEEDPLGGLGVEGEGTVVAAGVADHPDQLQLPLFGVFIRHPVEELSVQAG